MNRYRITSSSGKRRGGVIAQAFSSFIPVTNSVEEDHPVALRGEVEVFDLTHGIEGWALDLDNPSAPLRICLVSGSEVLFETSTDISRDDVQVASGQPTVSGFRFPQEALDALKALARDLESQKISVRVGDSPYVLRIRTPEQSTSYSAGLSTTGLSGPPKAFDLAVRLSRLKSHAAGMAAQPLRPLRDGGAGFIEAMSIDESGRIWVIGWMRRSPFVDYPIVIADEQKVTGGLSFTRFEREDLDAGSSGIIGVIDTNWRPRGTSEPYIYLDGQEAWHIQTVKPIRMLTAGEFHKFFLQLKDRCHTGHTAALQELITDPGIWTQTPDLLAPPLQLSLDRFLLLPSFGCLVSGWALSPVKTVESFGLKLGSTILQSDPDALYFKARPDLAGVLSHSDRLFHQAGFTAAFPGPVRLSDLTQITLKVFFTDGTSSNYPIDMKIVRSLGHATDLEAALELYPSLMSEPFFADFADALRSDARLTLDTLQSFQAQPSDAVIVLTAPKERSDLFLLFEEAGNYLRSAVDPAGVVIIASKKHLKSDATILFRDLVKDARCRCSLFFLDDTTYAFYALPKVLASVSAKTFVFAASGVHLTQAGWDAAGAALKAEAPPLTFFDIDDLAAPGRANRHSARCFGWSSAAFTEWFETAPLFFGGYYADNGLGTSKAPVVTHAASARFSRLPVSSALIAAVNQSAVISRD
jgi:hypothetical protein